MKLSGWGRYPAAKCALHAPKGETEMRAALASGPVIARGNGRSYGDSALCPTGTVSTRNMTRMIAFDPQSGILTAEAGVLLGDVIASFLPRGWFPSVTPGTKFVTIGGAIAADVHGKNHHVDGGFGNFVDWVDVMGAGGDVTRASRDENPELFQWTIGGMGLTGIILRAAIRLRRVETGWIRQETIAAPNLEAAMEAFEQNADAPYSVAWIDTLATGAHLGRSLIMLGRHAKLENLPMRYRAHPFARPAKSLLTMPFNAPAFALNRWSVRAFNALYYKMGAAKRGMSYQAWDPYFYPLDSILKWNRIYGRRGFVQFQCVLPDHTAHAGLEALLKTIAEAGSSSFLSVLKKMGPESGGLSFPMPGYTLALDFPVSDTVLKLMDRLDEITIAHEGRFYLAKDARMRAETFHKADARADDFADMRKHNGTGDAFASLQSERLNL